MEDRERIVTETTREVAEAATFGHIEVDVPEYPELRLLTKEMYGAWFHLTTTLLAIGFAPHTLVEGIESAERMEDDARDRVNERLTVG